MRDAGPLRGPADGLGVAPHVVMLGWPKDRVLVIDDDQGQSGRSVEQRDGFKRLLTEVTLGHVGLVLGLEMSRLARSSKDWHNLLEVCALFGTLLGDQDGVYNPNDTNDRLLARALCKLRLSMCAGVDDLNRILA